MLVLNDIRFRYPFIIAIIFAFYARTLSFGFIWDDFNYIVNSQILGAGTNFFDLWTKKKLTAVASFHAGYLATEAEDSPHLLLPKIKAELYIAHADQDKSMPSEQIQRLDQALAAFHGVYEVEKYSGALHGFTMADLPAFHAEALERHWKKLLALLDRVFP